jgi:hypothetical protein
MLHRFTISALYKEKVATKNNPFIMRRFLITGGSKLNPPGLNDCIN